MRTVQSLLMMRDPDLMKVSSVEENGSSPSSGDRQHDMSLSLPTNTFANSTTLPEPSSPFVNGGSDRGTESSNEDDNRTLCKSSAGPVKVNDNLTLLPRARRSLDTTSLNSGSSKTTDDEVITTADNLIDSISKRDFYTAESRSVKKIEKDVVKIRPKPTNSVSSAEDESGFSSMSSFQVNLSFF